VAVGVGCDLGTGHAVLCHGVDGVGVVPLGRPGQQLQEFQWRQRRGGSAAGGGRSRGYDALGGRRAQLGGSVEPVVLRIDAAGFVTNRIIHEEVEDGRNAAPGSGGPRPCGARIDDAAAGRRHGERGRGGGREAPAPQHAPAFHCTQCQWQV
jgi:hypothetical protein